MKILGIDENGYSGSMKIRGRGGDHDQLLPAGSARRRLCCIRQVASLSRQLGGKFHLFKANSHTNGVESHHIRMELDLMKVGFASELPLPAESARKRHRCIHQVLL